MPDCDVTRSWSPKVVALLAALGAATLAHGACAGSNAPGTEVTEQVRGYFCEGKADQIAFLNRKAQGDNEIMAADAVNKGISKASCAYYLPATAIPKGEQTVMKDGLVYKLQSYVFLPENKERWSGTVLGSLQVIAKDQDI